MTRYRKGQIWSDPTGNYGYAVDGIDPLKVSPWGMPIQRLNRNALEALPDADREAMFPRLHSQPSATAEEIKAGLIGRTIKAVEVHEQEGSFPQGDGDITLTLDDGNTVSISSWGYDAWGTDIRFDVIPAPSDQ